MPVSFLWFQSCALACEEELSVKRNQTPSGSLWIRHPQLICYRLLVAKFQSGGWVIALSIFLFGRLIGCQWWALRFPRKHVSQPNLTYPVKCSFFKDSPSLFSMSRRTGRMQESTWPTPTVVYMFLSQVILLHHKNRLYVTRRERKIKTAERDFLCLPFCSPKEPGLYTKPRGMCTGTWPEQWPIYTFHVKQQ